MKKNSSGFLKNVKKTWRYVTDGKKYLSLYALVSILEGVFYAVIPIVSARVILNLTSGMMSELIGAAFVVLLLELVTQISYFFDGYLYTKIYRMTLVSLQIEVARETLKLQTKEIDRESSGVFIDRLNKDTADISNIFIDYTFYISQIITNIGVIVAIFILNKYLFVYSVITSISVFMINRKRIKKQYEIQKEWKKIQEKKTGLIGELVRGIRDIKVLNASNNVLNQTSTKIKETVNEEIRMLNTRRIYTLLDNNVRILSDFVFIIIGCILFKYNLLAISTFVILYNYQGRVKNLLNGIVQLSELNKKFVVSSDRIYEIIDNNKYEKEQFGTINIKKLEGNIKFQNVTFGYNKNKKIIKKMTFEIKPNEKVAFVGKSGAGKTTIFGLITKMYNVDHGKILIDNFDINDLTKDSLRNNMSIITQNPYIFNFTIKENLLLAKEDATMHEIREACKLACIDDYIMSLPKKYNTLVGENGIILSGGQKQRLAIARALLMKTEIILFDEATSALDNETQSEIQKAIDNLSGEYTILIVAHRLSTVIDCDRIFVVDDGKIVDSGSHKELLNKCSLYKDLYEKDLKV